MIRVITTTKPSLWENNLLGIHTLTKEGGKIDLIKAVRQLTGLGLRDSKGFVDGSIGLEFDTENEREVALLFFQSLISIHSLAYNRGYHNRTEHKSDW